MCQFVTRVVFCKSWSMSWILMQHKAFNSKMFKVWLKINKINCFTLNIKVVIITPRNGDISHSGWLQTLCTSRIMVRWGGSVWGGGHIEVRWCSELDRGWGVFKEGHLPEYSYTHPNMLCLRLSHANSYVHIILSLGWSPSAAYALTTKTITVWSLEKHETHNCFV